MPYHAMCARACVRACVCVCHVRILLTIVAGSQYLEQGGKTVSLYDVTALSEQRQKR
jgi:hypothetical protein